ncbi:MULTISPECIES: helix-turn-helix domain-containing protein [unclassified Mycolicibacterium]|uniref:PucR family transcriptional regulator n=1 Tax=unclassified Mycolicibacterium TaxID=2636767 RepID=UPI0013083EA2|nr:MULTISPECIES: helix-turn-helix domain-containing protein [unclassified Mycolicibacterium]MUL84262.1 PucR family transcriptional regulator [Mycolicibacterium sp. CBMA 329]MUL89672.1 PucR family transcriptional regulator [Mycolicibacterium sp. CBMA 331]MUL99847.1 PucR family transcriptional regulator [Mycolicibacterium sp. CBMA 334]MUM30256.1 PucR family transcriptional regulator [Mycolicibacterium sp. CBMA 295]MUM39187.1 PucR family transcriptional regulator [Mycolicibacterium sp. CBMA 247]
MVTLDRLINVLGGYGVRLRAPAHGPCPAPRSTELRSVVMHEPGPVIGDVLLAVGAGSVAEAVQWAAAARAVVVLVRSPHSPDDDELLADNRIAVMTVEPEVSWSELAAVVYGVVLEGRETESGRGPTDLFALADSLADAVGGAVTIEDRRSAVLAYSRLQQHADPARAETILSRRAPQRLRTLFEARGVFRHLAESDEPMFVGGDDEHGMTGRMVVAARAGRELLGSIWVTCADPLPDARRAALADGARMVAMHLLRSRASADLERQVESELVIRLLEGAADATTAASRLALPQTPLRVIALRAHTADERHAALLLAFERATAGFGWSRPGRSALAGNTVYTVLPGAEAEAASTWVTGLRAALPEPVTVLAGISGPATAAELALARSEADECLALHEMRRGGSAPVYDEAWDDILLQRLRIAARSGRAPQRGPVAELRAHDQAHGTQYAATLRAWLEAQGDLAEAGRALGVHENTIRYRLRKMADLTQLNLDDAHKRLAMMIELAVTEELS